MATVYLPAPLRAACGGTESLALEARTVGEAIDLLAARWPEVRTRLCAGNQLAPGVQVSIDGALSARGLLARLEPDSEVHFLPALGGG